MAMTMPENRRFHVAMFPWFAFGHMTPFLHLANMLAERGHRITFIIPQKVESQLQILNLHPTLISFHPVTIPHVDGLPPGAETTADVKVSLVGLLATAMDRTIDQLEAALWGSNTDFLFYDLCPLAPVLASRLGIKAIFYNVAGTAAIAHAVGRAHGLSKGGMKITEAAELAAPPSGYPSSSVVLRQHEAWSMRFMSEPSGEGISFFERFITCMKGCDAICMRTCREIDGKYCDYIGTQCGKPVFLTGPVLPDHSPTPLENRWAQWLGGFNPGSVIFCAFGSETVVGKTEQFQEVVLGLELTGLPFLAVLKPPTGAATVEEALPEGFQERVAGRGVVHDGWVQQPQILSHPSVGCFVSHCGFGSTWEGLASDCQQVLVPNFGDQIMNARVLAEEIKVGVEVEKDENGWFSKESLCKAIKTAMDEGSEVGCLVRKNHAKWKEDLTREGFMSNYVDNFVRQLSDLKLYPTRT